MRRCACLLKCFSMVAAVIALGGCPGTSTPTRFFMLDPVPPTISTHPSGIDKNIYVSIDPVEVPAYLNRPQIVTHLAGAEYQVDEFNRWAEPLQDNLTRVITENLSEILASDGVDILGMSRPVKTDYVVAVQILRMEGMLGREILIVTRWSLFTGAERTLLLTRRSVMKEVLADDTYQGLVQAQNRMATALCREVADGIRQVVR